MEPPFVELDPSEFVQLVKGYIALGAHSARGLSTAEYTVACRNAWNATEVDEFYLGRYLHDGLANGGDSDLYGVAIAVFSVTTDESGYHWTPAFDYAAVRKPLGDRRRELIFVSPPGAALEESEEVREERVLLALFDVLGFEARLKELGLTEMHRRYGALIEKALVPSVAEDKLSLAVGLLLGENRQGYLQLPIRWAYFSDTILFWTKLHNAFVGTFFDRCSSLMCNALHVGVPLRGAISVGDAILHRPSNTFLGEPLVEAARLEAAQNVIGIAFGTSIRGIPVPPDRVIRYETPVKSGREHLPSGLVLDWPRHWREFHAASLPAALRAIRSEPVAYYDNAESFIEYSQAQHNWFMPELEAKLGPLGPLPDQSHRHGR